MDATDQRSAGPGHDARQPRLAMEADVKLGTKTGKRTEDAAENRAISGEVDPGSMCLTSFGVFLAKPLALPRRDDALVNKDTAALKPCLSPVEMCTLTATGGLLPAGTASSATRTNFHQTIPWFCPTEEINLRTSIQYAITYSSFWKLKVFQTRQGKL